MSTYCTMFLFDSWTQNWLICLLHWSFDSQRNPKFCNIWQIARFGLILLPPSIFASSKKLYFLGSIGFKNVSILLLHLNPDGLRMPKMFLIGIHLYYRAQLSLKQLTLFLLARSQSESYCLPRRLRLKNYSFRYLYLNPSSPNYTKFLHFVLTQYSNS